MCAKDPIQYLYEDGCRSLVGLASFNAVLVGYKAEADAAISKSVQDVDYGHINVCKRQDCRLASLSQDGAPSVEDN